MKFCKHCGNPLNPSHKVCTRCGRPIGHITQTAPKHEVHQPYPPGRYHDGYQFKKPNKPLIVISILVAMITITLIALFFFLKHQLSPEQTVDQISDALKKEDARHLSKLLTSDGKKLDDSEAQAYLRFLKNEGKLSELTQDLKDSLDKMNTSKTKTHTVSINNLAIIQVVKKGKRYGLFNHYEFNIPKYSIDMYAQDDGKINYEYNGKKHTIHLKKSETAHVGTFPLGNYQLEAKKQVGNKTFKENLTILMTPARSIVKENFKEKRFMIKADNTYKVKDIRLFINDKDKGKLEEYKTYGPYTSDEKVVVHLEGKVGKHLIKTNREQVKLPEGTEEYKTITLSFDPEEINKFDDDDTDSDDSNKDKKEDKEHKEKSDDKENDNQEKKKTDLTLSEAKDIIKQFDESAPSDSNHSYVLHPYMKWGDSVIDVKDKSGRTIYIYYISTKEKFISKGNIDGDHINSGYYH